MSTATKEHTPPTRRSAMRFSLAALTAGLTAPALAADTSPDAELIDVCGQLVAVETEQWLLIDHDEYAGDFGPNSTRYQRLTEEQKRLRELIDKRLPPRSPAGIVAIAQVALLWFDRDFDGNVDCCDRHSELLATLAESLAPRFVWPPRPGSCSTAHWAPPTSPAMVAAHKAEHAAWVAEIDAKIKAKTQAEDAERRRSMTTSLLTDDELRERMEAGRRLTAVAIQCRTELEVEMARRGLV